MEQLAKLLHDLGIDPRALLINIISFVLLVVLLTRLLFKPVGTFLDQRRRKIAEDLDRAEAARAEAEAELAQVRQRREALLQAVDEEAEVARRQALEEAEEVRRQARAAARDTELAARSTIRREQLEAEQQLRATAAQTAGAMARRILQSTLTEERHRALLDQFIADVERMAAEQSV